MSNRGGPARRAGLRASAQPSPPPDHAASEVRMDVAPDFNDAEMRDMDRFGALRLELSTAIAGATSVDKLVGVIPPDYAFTVRDIIRLFHRNVEKLSAARSSLERLRAHSRHKTFPTFLNSVSIPTLQFSDEFCKAASESMTAFNATMASTVQTAKEGLLAASIEAKERELEHFETQVALETTVETLIQKCNTRHQEIRKLIPMLS